MIIILIPINTSTKMKSTSKPSPKPPQSQPKPNQDPKYPQPQLPKQQLRKSSSSLKLTIKNQDASFSKLISTGQKINQNAGNRRKSMKSQGGTMGACGDVGRGKIVGWTQLDRVRYQLGIQRKLRESLDRENQMLKKEIAFLNNFGTSMRTSINSKRATNEETQSSNKQKILSRLNKKRQGITAMEKDNDSTGLYSAKNKTYVQKINEIYQQFTKKRISPIADDLYEIAQEYFTEFQETYSKLFVLSNQAKAEKTNIKEKMQNLLFLYQAPISYKYRLNDLARENSKQRLNSQKSSLNSSFSKIRVNSQVKNESQNQQQFQPRPNSYLIEQVQKLLSVIMKSSKLITKLVKTETYEKFMKKLKEKKL